MKLSSTSRLITAASTSLILMSATPLYAQPADGESVCGINSSEQFKYFVEIFLGDWTVTHLEGVAVSGNVVIPFPSSNDSEVITITLGDGMLIATHPEMQNPMEIGRLAGDIWGFAEEGKIHGLPMPKEITQDVVENMAGCNLDQLPNLLGLTTVNADGIVMHFAWYFTLVDTSNMIVAQHITASVHGIPMISRRMVRLTATGAKPAPVPMPEMDFTSLPEMEFTLD